MLKSIQEVSPPKQVQNKWADIRNCTRNTLAVWMVLIQLQILAGHLSQPTPEWYQGARCSAASPAWTQTC